MKTSSYLLFTTVYLLFAIVFVNGCSLEVPTDSEPGMDAEVPATIEVQLVFRNFASMEAVETEFYITDGQLEVVPDDLFLPENRLRAGLGVAGTGILEPFDTDALIVPCTPGMVIGTTGGTFIDNESGAERGVGQPRWVESQAVGFCGREVIFEFATEGDGFVTTITVGPRS